MSLLKKLAGLYRRKFPDLKFTVRRPKLESDFGLTGFDKKKGRFIIEICSSYDEAIACFILCHELSHAISWHACQPPEEPHGQPFWDAYKKTYSIYEEFCDSHNG